MHNGTCCVCKTSSILVFSLSCKHTLCADDLSNYLNSALGDISMFPVKCPMHFDNCKGTVDANIARRVLNKIQYERFLEFSDRATYGDGE
jgi:hypothetical protein